MTQAIVILSGTSNIYGVAQNARTVDLTESFQYQYTHLGAQAPLPIGPPAGVGAVNPTTPIDYEILTYIFRSCEMYFGPDARYFLPYTHYIEVRERDLVKTMSIPDFFWLTPATWDARGWSNLVGQDSNGRLYIPFPQIIEHNRNTIHNIIERNGDQHRMMHNPSPRIPPIKAEIKTPRGPKIGRNPRKLGI